MIQRIAGAQTVTQFADQLSQKLSAQIAVWKQQPVNVEGWAWESHQNGVTTSYGKLHTAVPVETPQPVTQCSDDNHISLRMKNLNEKIDAAYLGNATPVIEEQLAKAGTRLAMLLNQLAP